jgi:steroid 5-alpha reductase family enzyme
MPTLIVFAGCLPLYVVTESAAGWQVWDSAGLLIGVAAIWLEARADLELKSFQLARHSRAELLTTGVWAWCRHPNYLGEIGFWVALACFALGTGSTALWSLIGAAAMIVLFVGVSIPMIEKKLDAGKPGYAEYRAHTPMLLPLGRWTANRG